MYVGESINEIEPKETFWDNIKVEDMSFNHFITVFSNELVPKYIPEKDIKYWIDELIKNCPLYYKFISNLYSFKFKHNNDGIFYKQNDRRNSYHFNFDMFHDIIQELCEYYDLDLKLFLTSFNNMFRYYINDFKNESNIKNGLIEFSTYTGVDLNNINKEGMVILLKSLAKYPFSSQAISFNLYGPTFYHNIETVFLQYWYEVQTLKKERIFSKERQLTWLDFDTELIKELSYETIREMIFMLCDVGITEYNLFKIKEYGIQYAEKVLSEKKKYKTIEDLFLDDRISTCMDIVKEISIRDTKKGNITSEFKEGICSVLRTIVDECKLVEMLIRLNELIIIYINSKKQVDYNNIITALNIMEPRTGKMVNMKDDFTSLTPHSFCLFVQICVSVIDNPDINPLLKDIAKKFAKDCNQCKKYYTCLEVNKEKKFYVYCEHKTIHYYTFTKWWYMYMALVEKFYNQKYADMKLSEYYQKSFQVWYPKASYCDKCYEQYKNLEEIVNNSTKGLASYKPENEDLLSYKFLILIMKNKIPKYRAIYNSNCDIPVQSKDNSLIKAYDNHKREIEYKITNLKSSLKDLLQSMQLETQEIIKFYD